MAGTPNSLITPQQVKASYAVCSNPKTNFADTSQAQQLISSSDNVNGALVKRIYAISRATASAENNCQLYRSKTSGTTMFYADNVILPAGAVGSSAAAVKAVFDYTADEPLRLAAGEELWVAIGLAGNVIFVAEYEAF